MMVFHRNSRWSRKRGGKNGVMATTSVNFSCRDTSRNRKATEQLFARHLLCMAPSYCITFCSTADTQKLKLAEVANQQENPSARNYSLARQQLSAHFKHIWPAKNTGERKKEKSLILEQHVTLSQTSGLKHLSVSKERLQLNDQTLRWTDVVLLQ